MRCLRIFAVWVVAAGTGLAAADEMAAGFAEPPAGTRPWCYWYWISDNVSKEGITRDLEAMARVGIGEALIGNVVDPDTPPGEVRLLSDEWFDCMAHAAIEARRLGVKIGVFNGPGWSQSGGPWVSPAQAMRYVVSSETRVRGPAKFEGKLPVPREPFQDIAVLAFPAPRGDGDAMHSPGVRCLPEVASPKHMVDDDVATACAFPDGANAAGKSFAVDLEFAEPFTARSLALHPGGGSFSAKCELSAANAEGEFRRICEFVMDRRGLSRPKYAVNVGPMLRGPAVVSFAATTARVFRLKVTLLAVEGAGSVGGSAESVSDAPGLAEIILSGAARLDRAIEKQLGKMHPTPLPDFGSYLWPSPAEPESADLMIPADRIVDLGERMTAEGVLRWDVPDGEWVLLRTGMTPTGAQNHPTTDQGRGPECDKMSRAAIEAHFNGFMARIMDRIPKEARQALNHVIIDSYEVGSENWTDGFHETFQKACGYDPRPWLPVLTGRIVGSAGQSDRFLWDLRRHVADRIATEYVGGLRDIAHRHGMRLWLENYGHWGFPGEFLQYGGQSDDLGGEFWIREGSPVSQAGIELRAASSAAHTYGKRQVYSEAFTSARSFLEAPGNIKALGDWAFCHGINHLVFHVYIHQPWEDRKPGVNAWFGTEFNRHNTWFDQSKGFVDYLRRCQFLLQRGTSAADVAYFIGEDAPKMTGIRQPAPPPGYDFDYINAEALLNRARVIEGRIALPDGPSYALLVLPPLDTMRPETLRRIRDLVAEGARVLGPPPRRSPSLRGYPDCDREVERLAAELWGELARNDAGDLAGRTFGKGRVFRGADLAWALREAGAEPAVVAPEGILWTYRRDGETDIYFLSNQKNEPVLADISFRAVGRVPEFWRPDTGEREATAWFEAKEGRTRVPVALDANGSVFLVFRETVAGPSVARVLKDGAPVGPAGGKACPVRVIRGAGGEVSVIAAGKGRYTLVRTDGKESVIDVTLPPAVAVSAPWTLSFPPVPGAPAHPFELKELISWSEHADDAVKYFSGTATYRGTLGLPPDVMRPGRRLWLDLGAVEVIAQVSVNGKDVGTLWKKPFAADISDVARPGANDIEVKVTNLWWNRLVGDDRLPPEARTTFTTARPRVPRNKLLPSGLLGPVKVSVSETRAQPQ
ncbi:MAG TPA: glycosyl hydrolase [Verrucomicrobiae bacterium]|nr:glycosyl hydrolase [Verrucomicrobiae bacterium]